MNRAKQEALADTKIETRLRFSKTRQVNYKLIEIYRG